MHLRKHFYDNAQNGIRTLQKQNIKICAKHTTERNEIGELIKNYNKGERYHLMNEDLKNEKSKGNETNGGNEKENVRKYEFNKMEINKKEVLTKKFKREHKILYDFNTNCFNIYEKRNYSHGNANFLKNTTGRNATVRDKTELSGDNRNETIRRDNEQNRNFYILQKNQKSYLVNENATNMYINKLHDYLNLAHRSESDKIKINKILMKLKNENLTTVSILHILKDLCIFYLKKSSKHLEEPVTLNYMENKNASKKVKNYLEEYFVYIENYLRDYSTFINEENMLDLFKYLYYLNYPLSRNTMELLLERFYLCIDKMDILKAVQIYYITQSFYKHCYIKKPDYYLSLVVDEKLKAWFSQKPYAFPIDLNTQKYLLNSYKNSYWDQKKGSIEITTPPIFPSTFVENRMKIKTVDKKTNNELYEISEESKELMQIFKYIHNFHDNMNFFYHYNVMHFIEKDLDHFSLNELLIILEKYNNDRYDVFTAKIVNRLIQRVDQMDENNLVLLAKHLKRFKNGTHSFLANSVGENETKTTSNYLVLLTVVDKILETVRKDKDFFLPDNTASILLNINEIMHTIVNKMDVFKKEDKREESGIRDTPTKDTQHTNKNETQPTNGNELHRKIQREMVTFCDEHINNVHSFDTVLNLYLFYIKNEFIKSRTIQIFEQKLKTNKNKLSKQNISDIILSLSMFPFHTTKMLPYLENVINERLEESNDMYENGMNVEDIMKKTGTNELTFRENNINGTILNYQTNHLIDVSMSLGIIGRKNLKMWNYIDVDKVILTINKHLLLYLSYSFLLTNYWNTLSWYFVIKRIVEDVRVFKRKHYELLYEILKCSLLFNVIDLTNFTNNSFEHLSNTTTTNSFVKNAKQKGTNESSHHFVKNFNYLLTTSYNHYKLKLIKNQYISKVPYEEVFNYLKIAYEKNIEFKQLYLIPFLLKDYKIIIDPLPSTPIHKSSGFIMGEIQLKHKVFQFDKFTVLSFCDALWDKHIIVDTKGNRKYDIKALSEHFQTYIESHIKMESMKQSFNASTNVTNSVVVNGTPKDEKQTNQISYLKVKRRYAPLPSSKKYLTNKGGVQDPNKYLKVKTKVGKR